MTKTAAPNGVLEHDREDEDPDLPPARGSTTRREQTRGSRRDAVETRLGELAGVVNAATAAVIALVAEALDDDLWSGVGLRSPAHWLSWRAGISTATARRITDIAARRGELPALDEALEAGALSVDAAALIARHVPEGFDDAAVELARSATIGHLAAVLPRYGWPHDSPDTSADEAADGGAAGRVGGAAGQAGEADADSTHEEHPGDRENSPDGSDSSDDPTSSHADDPGDDVGDDAAEDAGGTDTDAGAKAHGHASSRDPWHPGSSRQRDERADDPARISWWWDDHQRFRLSASLPTDQGLLLEAALRTARRDAWEQAASAAADGAPSSPSESPNGHDSGEPHGTDGRSSFPGLTAGNGHGSRREALALLAASYLDHGPGGRADRDRHRILTHLDLDPHGRNQLRGHLGPVLPRHLRHLLTCDSTLTPVWTRQGTPLPSVADNASSPTVSGTSSRTATAAARFPVAPSEPGCTSITSDTGRTAARPIRTIWSPFVPVTIDCTIGAICRYPVIPNATVRVAW